MPNKDKLTQEYTAKFGTLSIHRGTDDKNNKLFSWEPIPDCTGANCPLKRIGTCTYDTDTYSKCRVIGGIVKAAAINIIKNHGKKMTNSQRNRVGTHLMPLYVTLARLYVYEASLAAPNFNDNKGNPKINPIYKEIRETIRGIDLQWKNIGLTKEDEGESEEGYYARLEREAMDAMNKRNNARDKKSSKQVIRLKPKDKMEA